MVDYGGDAWYNWKITEGSKLFYMVHGYIPLGCFWIPRNLSWWVYSFQTFVVVICIVRAEVMGKIYVFLVKSISLLRRVSPSTFQWKYPWFIQTGFMISFTVCLGFQLAQLNYWYAVWHDEPQRQRPCRENNSIVENPNLQVIAMK